MPHARFIALLARRSIRRRPKSAELRQTIRARLSRDARLEQNAARAQAARGSDREDRREISRSVRAADGQRVSLTRGIPSREDGEGPDSCKTRHASDEWRPS